MMRMTCLYIFSIILLCLSGCASNSVTTQTNMETPSLGLVEPTITFTTTPTETVTSTLAATLTPLQANEKIRAYLQNPIDCTAPCFWGITPEQTTFKTATSIFAFLGLEPEHTLTLNGQDFYDINYHTEKGLEVSVLLTVQEGIVKSLNIGMTDTSEVGNPRTWPAYSPETLIQTYGNPSRVEFSLGRAAPNPSHSMILFFEKVDIIILYLGQWDSFLKNSSTLELCPLTNKIDFIKIWMGNEPLYPPPPNVPLEQATSLTLEGFSKLILGNPNKACFNLKGEVFP